MRKAGRVVLILLIVALLIVGGVYAVAQVRFDHVYSIQPAPVQIPSDEQAIEYGKELAAFSCAGCHGPDMGGQVMSESLLDGRAAPPNLTSGQGGIGATYGDEDWVRAIRHGVGPDGRALLGMPSDQFGGLDNSSLGVLIAYLKAVPPVDNVLSKTTIGLLPRVNFLLGRDPLLAAELIDHQALIDPLETLLDGGETLDEVEE